MSKFLIVQNILRLHEVGKRDLYPRDFVCGRLWLEETSQRITVRGHLSPKVAEGQRERGRDKKTVPVRRLSP